MIKLAGVVVLYNPTIENIDKINSYIDEIDKMYIVDNSIKSNIDIIPKNSKIEYISYNENLGMAKALNIGASNAIKDNYNWLLTMDQDSKLSSTVLRQMKDYLSTTNTDNIGLISPLHLTKQSVEYNGEIEDLIEVMTSGNIINLSAYKTIGGYNEDLFIDGVDFDYCMNLNVHNYKVRRLNYCKMEHELGNARKVKIFSKIIYCSNHNYIRRYYMMRNYNYICEKYEKYFPEYCAKIKRGLRGQIKNVIVFEKDKFRKVRNMYRGYRDYKKKKVGKYPYK